MPMTPFYTRFRDLAFREMRVAHVRGGPDLPDGEYGFLEFYCDEPNCDCRRVVISVVSRAAEGKIWATINYGWEKPEYYATWTKSKELAQDMSGAVLDPLNPQTQYSDALLRLFEYILEDPAYVARLKRHYQMFKAEVKRETDAKRARKPKGRRSRRRHS